MRMTVGARKSIVYLCRTIGVPDHDRCNALAREGHRVTLIDWSGGSDYIWHLPDEALYTSIAIPMRRDPIRFAGSIFTLMRRCLEARPELLLVYGYNDLALFIVALLWAALGTRVVSMNDSKFDDYRRNWLGDLIKVVMLAPYRAFVAATDRTADYLYYLTGRRSEVYHCAINVDRISAAARPAWDRTPFEERYFLMVGRFVEKKNHLLLLDHFERYATEVTRPRRLRLVGYGHMEALIRKRIEESPVLSSLVTVDGYVSAADMPGVLGGALALLLPSYEEQFGIVVTEALAARIPVVVSPACGAADLVDSDVNGYVISHRNAEGWVNAMRELGEDRQLWTRLSDNTEQHARLAHVTVFVNAVVRLAAP